MRTRKANSGAVMACAFLALAVTTAAGQTGGNSIQPTAVEFEKEVARQLDSNAAAPPEVCRGVIERLKADRLVTDRTIARCVEAHINADDKRAGANRYAATDQFIADVIALLRDRELLKAQLLARQGSIAVSAANFAKASQAFEAALKAVQPVRLEADLQRMSVLVDLGQSLLSQKRNKEAEPYFLEALSYPWYTIVGFPNQMRMLRDQYIQAGRGLIASRRGNLLALQDIVFVPATDAELRPALDKAVQEAKGSK